MDDFIKRLDGAIGWGVPDSESTGMSHSDLVNLIYECKRRLITPVDAPAKAPNKPLVPDDGDEIVMPSCADELASSQAEVAELTKLLAATRALLATKVAELEGALRQRNTNRAEINRLSRENLEQANANMSESCRTEILRRMSKIAKHFDAIEREVTNG